MTRVPRTHEEIERLKVRLTELQSEHRALDEMIARMSEAVYVDQLQLRRLKKRKLQLKDLITRLRSELIPDLDA
ncbi:MAG: YdcH family protein [Gammaproteobacteria bacterium]